MNPQLWSRHAAITVTLYNSVLLTAAMESVKISSNEFLTLFSRQKPVGWEWGYQLVVQ